MVAASVGVAVADSAGEGLQVDGDRVSMTPRYGLFRWLYHMWIGPMHVRRVFTREAFLRIEQTIALGERDHYAQVRFAAESSLSTPELWREVDARHRAVDVFSSLRIWDTQDNNGVLVYLLWADHAIEIVTDRGATASIDPAVWESACAQFTNACRDGRHVEGVISAIHTINQALARAFPSGGIDTPDELPNEPLILR
jgi:uncharacterized membrane protein